MNGVKFYVDKLFAGMTLILLSIYLTYSLSSLINRLADPPRDLIDISGLQLETGIVGLAVGAALAALVAGRHNRHGGRDLLATSSHPASRRVMTQFLAVVSPVLGGWLIFIVVTTVQNRIQGALILGLLVLGVGALAIMCCVALGQVIGIWLRPSLAVFAAFAGTYIFAGIFAIFGDDFWWQWLGPAFGDSLEPYPKSLWLVGEYAWFLGLTMVLLTLNMKLVSSPRKAPRLLLIASIAVTTAGACLLALNGADASPDTYSSLP